MVPLTISRQTDGEIYLAGERVPAGKYRQIEGGREVRLAREDLLPGSLDGRVACYERVPDRRTDFPRREQRLGAS